MKNTNKKIIPIFFAIDDNYVKFFAVALKSIMDKADKSYVYNIHILNTGLSKQNKQDIIDLASENKNFNIYFNDVTAKIKHLAGQMQLRDYYTLTTYYRLFIQSMFPEYDKAIYLDSDLVCVQDISIYYNIDISNYLLAATADETVYTDKNFSEYSEQVVSVPRNEYFNAGILLMNLKKFREQDLQSNFIKLLAQYKFVVAQDQDYLNVLCKNQTLLLPAGYNKTPTKLKGFNAKNLFFIHYKINWRPWKYSGIMYEKHFWKYAKQTKYYDEIINMRDNYSEENKQKDKLVITNMHKLCDEEILKFKEYSILNKLEVKLYGKIAR